jgi:hypothetical protein
MMFGWDIEPGSHFQRQGCTQARQRTPPTTGKTFIYHPTTGICEHRP